MKYDKGAYVITSDGNIGLIEGVLCLVNEGEIYLVNIHGDKQIMRKDSILRETKLNKTIINLEEII